MFILPSELCDIHMRVLSMASMSDATEVQVGESSVTHLNNKEIMHNKDVV